MKVYLNYMYKPGTKLYGQGGVVMLELEMNHLFLIAIYLRKLGGSGRLFDVS